MCRERLEGIMLASEETYVVVGEGTTEETTTEGSTKGGGSVAAQHCGVMSGGVVKLVFSVVEYYYDASVCDRF